MNGYNEEFSNKEYIDLEVQLIQIPKTKKMLKYKYLCFCNCMYLLFVFIIIIYYFIK